MIEPRNELGVFHGNCIELKGHFNNYYQSVNFVYNEDMRAYIPSKSVLYNPTTNLIPAIYYIDPKMAPELEKALITIDRGSVITAVSVLGTEIVLDHIILQCNIMETYGIALHSDVWIYGKVGAYLASNKFGGYDYCIDKIINIKTWE